MTQIISKTYIAFYIKEHKEKTLVWGCYSTMGGTELAEIKWYPAWRKYCFFPVANTIFDKDCLEDILRFIDQANAEHRAKRDSSQSLRMTPSKKGMVKNGQG